MTKLGEETTEKPFEDEITGTLKLAEETMEKSVVGEEETE